MTDPRRDELTVFNRIREEGGHPWRALDPLVQTCFRGLVTDSATEACRRFMGACLRSHTPKAVRHIELEPDEPMRWQCGFNGSQLHESSESTKYEAKEPPFGSLH